METPRTFGEYVTMAREQQGISAKKLAKKLGKHPTTIGRVESGLIAVPTPDYFMDLVDTLDLDIITAVHLLEPYRRIRDCIVNAIQKGGDNE